LLALANSIAILGNSAKSARLTLNLQDLRFAFLIKEELRALVAHTSENFVHKLNKSSVVDWLGQLNVPEVTWTIFLRYKIESLDNRSSKIRKLE
jgi:hypothetical protein